MAHYQSTVRMLRAQTWMLVDSRELVPGDIFELTPDLTLLPCDCVLLSGDALINESMLTGESVPVAKAAASETDLELLQRSGEINSKFYLFGGTNVIRARLNSGEGFGQARTGPLAMVIRTGFNTVKGGLLRSMLFPKPNQFQFYQDSFKFIGVLAIIGKIDCIFNKRCCLCNFSSIQPFSALSTRSSILYSAG
jgi:cation-transporting ATPase 13A3/4/5